VPAEKFDGRKPQFLATFGKSKTIVSVHGYVSTSIPNMVAVPHPPLRSAVPFVCGVGQVNFESI